MEAIPGTAVITAHDGDQACQLVDEEVGVVARKAM